MPEGEEAKELKERAALADDLNDCKTEGVFFIQYACELSEAKALRQVYGLYFSCTAVFIYFFATIFFDYIRAVEATNQLDYDVKTYTAGDYSVEFKIQHCQYDNWA